jgi:hypothetical protein
MANAIPFHSASIQKESLQDSSIQKESLQDNSIPREGIQDNPIQKENLQDSSIQKESLQDTSRLEDYVLTSKTGSPLSLRELFKAKNESLRKRKEEEKPKVKESTIKPMYSRLMGYTEELDIILSRYKLMILEDKIAEKAYMDLSEYRCYADIDETKIPLLEERCKRYGIDSYRYGLYPVVFLVDILGLGVHQK